MNEHTQEWPQLYALASTGKVKTWKIEVQGNPDGTATVTSTFGQLDGKLQAKVEIVREGKNVGRSNETSPYAQAVAEAQSDYQRKLDKKYIPEIPTSSNEPDILLPMLALDYRKRSHDIIYPCYVQPKLNGVRCLAKKTEGTVLFTSRKFKEFPREVTAHLVAPLLERMNENEILDGEFYVHGWSFQRIIRTAKKGRPWATEMEFHIFDLVTPSAPFFERDALLRERFNWTHPNLKMVVAHTVDHPSRVKDLHDQFVAEGYEGIIIRNRAGLYVMDHRSKDLQKYKEFVDQEFPIVGGEAEIVYDSGISQEQKAVVFTCKTPEGLLFNVRPKGSVGDRIAMFADLPFFVGKQLTVRYQELSEDRKPIFPVGLAVRDYE